MKYIYFYGTWCQPCKQLSPIMSNIESKGISVLKIDVDENYNLASSNNIRNVPTVILVDKNGNEINRTIGVKSEDYFIENYRNNLAM